MSILIEENGVYGLDVSKAIWASDCMHEEYHAAGVCLCDVDFIVETETKLLLVEYKNALIERAQKPEAFKPESDKMINKVARKYYDSLHFLAVFGKNKPKEYIYILEYPHGDSVSRRAIRNKIKKLLPFKLQQKAESGQKMIDKLEVLSINEWNEHIEYQNYPFRRVLENHEM